MPQIAAAVERFTSEPLQAEAFRVLMRAFGVATETPAIDDPDDASGTSGGGGKGAPEDNPTATRKKAAARKATGPKAKQSFGLDKTLDLVKGGSPSFKEFYEAKQPKSVMEKALV